MEQDFDVRALQTEIHELLAAALDRDDQHAAELERRALQHVTELDRRDDQHIAELGRRDGLHTAELLRRDDVHAHERSPNARSPSSASRSTNTATSPPR